MKSNNKKIVEQLKKRIGKIGKKIFQKFTKEIKIKKSTSKKNDILKILLNMLPKYKKLTEESTKADLLNSTKDDLVKMIGSKEDQMNRIIGESLIQVFKSVDDVLENSVSDRQIEIGLTQLMTTYSNVLNTNKLKIENKEIINELVDQIRFNLDNIGRFWIGEQSRHEYFVDLLNVIIGSIKVNRFEEEWGLEIIQDMTRDNIERYSSFVPQGMLISGIEILLKEGELTKEKYEEIVKEVKELSKD